ncbi:MAG TPA: PP2C family protein-serine/threonine phosphatase [Silvibacterium sp.]|nr:PP2C family protein-serine/threonine phosphatase [Silvibacterium sp.]
MDTSHQPSKEDSPPRRGWLGWGAGHVGTGVLRLQLVLVTVAIVVFAFSRIFGAEFHLLQTLTFTLLIGNWTNFLVTRATPLFKRKFPWNWVIFLLVLALVGASGAVLTEVVATFVFYAGDTTLFFKHIVFDLQFTILVSLIFGFISFAFGTQTERMEVRNRELQGQVQLGQMKEQSHEAELAQAHEIQRHLLPRETPQIAGFQIACAWQPAKAVSGDYFDVLPLGEGKLGLCIADVSGKGITAALLMANLQASVKAFAKETTSPSALCAKLNSVLCDTVAPGKFVTLFYGIIDTQRRKLHYENAGHCLPLLVHADGSIEMPASYSGVLGLFSHWMYQDSELQLQSGDCLVLMTDGVLEAANKNEEEFGYQRLIEVVKEKRGSGAHGIRSAILEAVSAFCNGKFDDDASLIVVTVD